MTSFGRSCWVQWPQPSRTCAPSSLVTKLRMMAIGSVAIPNALTRQTTAFTGVVVSFNGALNDPLGLTIAPNGHIITTNGGDGNLVETTPGGAQVAVKTVDTVTGAGSLFGLAIVPGGQGVYFVDDGDNTLKVLESKQPHENDDDNGDD